MQLFSLFPVLILVFVAELLGLLLGLQMHSKLAVNPLMVFTWMESASLMDILLATTSGLLPLVTILQFMDISIVPVLLTIGMLLHVAPLPLSFVGEKYFCASVKPLSENICDGRRCSGPCCHFHSPPWFSVPLPASTSDDIEVRICGDSPVTDEDVFVRQLQLLVQ